MNEFVNYIHAFTIFGAIVIGGLVYGLTHVAKVGFGWEGRPVRQFQFWLSMALGMLQEWALAPNGADWKFIVLTTLKGFLVGIAISLVALGVHNRYRRSYKRRQQKNESLEG